MFLAPDDITRPGRAPVAPLFRISETLLEQGSGVVNEDSLALGRDVFIVCDGATSLVDSGVPGGQIAARITADTFKANPGLDLRQRAGKANEAIRVEMERNGIGTMAREQLWSTSFAVVQVDGETINWVQTGDCAVLLLHDDGSHNLVNSLPVQDHQVLALWKRVGPLVEGSIHEVLADQILEVRKCMNRSFGVLNGEAHALDFIQGGSFHTQGISDVLLFSDGLFPPAADPCQPLDSDLLAGLYRQAGLGGVRDYIRARQADDPRCCRYPRFKMHDDISAIALQRV